MSAAPNHEPPTTDQRLTRLEVLIENLIARVTRLETVVVTKDDLQSCQFATKSDLEAAVSAQKTELAAAVSTLKADQAAAVSAQKADLGIAVSTLKAGFHESITSLIKWLVGIMFVGGATGIAALNLTFNIAIAKIAIELQAARPPAAITAPAKPR